MEKKKRKKVYHGLPARIDDLYDRSCSPTNITFTGLSCHLIQNLILTKKKKGKLLHVGNPYGDNPFLHSTATRKTDPYYNHKQHKAMEQTLSFDDVKGPLTQPRTTTPLLDRSQVWVNLSLVDPRIMNSTMSWAAGNMLGLVETKPWNADTAVVVISIKIVIILIARYSKLADDGNTSHGHTMHPQTIHCLLALELHKLKRPGKAFSHYFKRWTGKRCLFSAIVLVEPEGAPT